jgi:large conductance mechanosensitive channel
MGLLQEFKDFALKGNFVDMAIGIVIGAGFGKIVNEFVEKIIMPLVGLVGGVDFSKFDVPLKAAATVDGKEVPAVNLGVGSFLTSIVQFMIVAFAIFMVVKAMNAARARFEQKKVEAPAAPPEDVMLLREIRDALRNR